MANWNAGQNYYPPPPPGGQYYGGPPPQQGFYGQTPQAPYGQGPYAGYPNNFQQPPMQPGGFLAGQPANYGDTYEGGKVFNFSDESIRNEFVRKVYSILTIQLIVSFGFVALCTFHTGIRAFMVNSPAILIIALITMFATMIVLTCCEGVRRQSPANVIVLAIFTLAESFLLGAASITASGNSVMMAVALTAFICLGLTAFAFQTKYDFTGCGPYLFIAILVLLGASLIIALFGTRTPMVQIVMGVFGAMIFSFYLVYDTQLMLGGNHKYSISPEEYIFAALSLYLDIVQIFLYLLQIFRALDES